MSELQKLKRKLYLFLLEKEELSQSEVDIMYALGRDKDIQEPSRKEEQRVAVPSYEPKPDNSKYSKLKVDW